MVHTIFVDPSTVVKQDGKTAKRKANAGVPITIWPQYKLAGLDDHVFAVVAPTEWWLATLLHTLRQRSNVSSVRNLQTELADRARQWIRSGLDSINVTSRADDDSDDAEVDQRPSRYRSLSGMSTTRTKLLNVRIDGATVTVLNYGRMFVLLLDDAGIRFIHDNIVTACAIMCRDGAADASASSSTSRAAFAFADETPNVRDKVMWDCDANAWKVIYTSAFGKVTSLRDMDNQTLVVPECATEAEYDTKKKDSYIRAIQTWSAFDKSKRDRIDTLASPSTMEQSVALAGKWAADSASCVL
jgi:hypothetical protein